MSAWDYLGFIDPNATQQAAPETRLLEDVVMRCRPQLFIVTNTKAERTCSWTTAASITSWPGKTSSSAFDLPHLAR